MATQIQKNTKKLVERKLDILFAKQQELNSNAGDNTSNGLPKAEGGYSVPQLPYQNRSTYWPQGGQQALGTMNNNYMPNLYGGMLPNASVTAQGYNSMYNPISLSGATVNGTRTQPSNFWDTTGINPNNFYNNQSSTAPTGTNTMTVPFNGTPDWGTPPPEDFVNTSTQPNTVGKSNVNSNNPSLQQKGNFAPAEPNYDWNTAYPGKRKEGTNNDLWKTKANVSALKVPNLGGETSQQARDLYNSLESPKLTPNKTTPATANPNAGKLDWGKAGTFAGQVAPMVYNMIKGLQRPEKTTPNYNPYESKIRSLMANRRFNIDPMLNANLTAQAVTNRNIRNIANSRGEMMGNFGATQNYRMAGDASAWAQKNNMDNQYMAEQAQMDANLGGARANMDWMTQTANSQNKAATNSFLGQGFNDLGRFAQTQQLMGNQQMRDSQLAGLYPDMYGVYNFMYGAQDIVNSTKKPKKTF